jgi:hypothetical protein
MQAGAEHVQYQLDFRTSGKLVISMVPFIQSMIYEMPENMLRAVSNPAASHRCTGNTSNPERLNDMNPRFLCTWSHNRCASVSGLVLTSVQQCLSCVLVCSRLTGVIAKSWPRLRSICNSLSICYSPFHVMDPVVLTWWMDASYAENQDMKGHTGGVLFRGQGAMYSASTR